MFNKYVFLGLIVLTLTLVLPRNNMDKQAYSQLVLGDSTLVSGYISENTTWTADNSPYTVTGNVIVENDAFLTIEPGVTVKFSGETNLIIDGGIMAQGNPEHVITFTSNYTTPAPGDWGTLHFRGSEPVPNFVMDYCTIEYATTGVTASGTRVSNTQISLCSSSGWTGSATFFKVNITQNGLGSSWYIGGVVWAEGSCFNECRISENTNAGILYECMNGGITVVNCEIVGNFGDGVQPWHPQLQNTSFTGTTISNNTGYGIGNSVLYDLYQGTLTNCTVCHNGKSGLRTGSKVSIYNCTVSNNSWNGIEGGEFVRDCIVTYNGGTGISAAAVEGCFVASNGGTGVSSGSILRTTILNNGGSGVVEGSPCQCNIYDNSPYDLKLTSFGDINATYNWWGTTNESLIEAHIYDYYDDYNLGKVLYKPYLTAPFTEDTIPPSITSVSNYPLTPSYDEETAVSSTITDNVEVDKAFLSHTDGLEWQNISMNRFGDVFNATLPAQSFGTTVQYKIYANDTNGNEAESSTFSYIVGDFVAPEINTVEWKPTSPFPYVPSNGTRANEPTLVVANLSEPVGASGMSTALLSYRTEGGEWWNTTMTFNSTTGLWTTMIPGQSNDAGTVEFLIKAYDTAGNSNSSEINSFEIRSLVPGDINGDGWVNAKDAVILGTYFGQH